MAVAPSELSTRVRLSDPKPDRCAACFAGADAAQRFVDFDAAIDRGTFVDPDSLAVLESIDDLHLCEACVRQAAEALGLKPELHSKQYQEIRGLRLQVEHWRAAEQRAREDAEMWRARARALEPEKRTGERRGR